MSILEIVISGAMIYLAYKTGRQIGRAEENHRCRMAAWDARDAAWESGAIESWRRIKALAWKIFDEQNTAGG